jgi:hypothetical protein
MSEGNAQRYEIQLDNEPLFKMYHYAAGTSNDKTIWSDAAKTTPLAQPAVADASGQLSFFADGRYRMKFHDSDDVPISGMDYDDFLITADFATTFEDNQGTVLPSASATNKGHLFTLFDGSSNILGIYQSDGTQYKAMVQFTASGDQIFDAVVPKKHPHYDITHSTWGADKTGASDSTTAINNAIADVPAAGGVIYAPTGIYELSGNLTVTNKHIKFKGDGQGKSIFRWTSAGGIDVNLNSIYQTFDFDGITLETEVAGGADAINVFWPTTVADPYNNLTIENAEIRPALANEATAYFDKGVVLVNAKHGVISNLFYRGADNTRPAGTRGIQITGDSTAINITNGSYISFAEIGLEVSGNAQDISFNNGVIAEVDTGAYFNFSAAKVTNDISNCDITAFKKGIRAEYCTKSNFSNNQISKSSTSTDDFIGIDIETNSSNNIISLNNIFGAGAGGQEDSIVCDGDDNTITYNRTINHRYAVHLTSGANNNLVKFNTKSGGGGSQTTFNEGGSTTPNIIENNTPPMPIPKILIDADTTPSVKTVNDELIFQANNTAATTITAFDDMYLGQIVRLRVGNGNTTIQHGGGAGQFWLANAVNFVMSTGDTLTVQAIGTAGALIFYEIARTT